MIAAIVDGMLVLLSITFLCGYVYRVFIRKSARINLEGAGLLGLLAMVLTDMLPVYVQGRAMGSGIHMRFGLLLYLFCVGIQRLKKDHSTKSRELYLIRQMNPHFIFNTLGTIRIVTKTNANLAYDMLYDFSKCLRAMLRPFLGTDRIPFKEEAAHIISYTNLEKIRFGDHITVRMEIAEDDFLLPPLSVQPLVENAVRYGLQKGRRKGVVTVRSYQTASEYIVQVEDDGTGFDISRCRNMRGDNGPEACGLQRVRYRVEHLAGGYVDIRSFEGTGTVITLHFPKGKKRKVSWKYEDEDDSG